MASGTFSAVRRRNVFPVTTILNVRTRDVDCSALADSPEDGQFVTAFGGSNTAAGVVYHAVDAAAMAASVVAGLVEADYTSLAMVWGSAMRSDRQALGDTRVATFAHNGVEVECKLFNADDAVALATTYPDGMNVSVAGNTVALQGAAIGARLVLCPMTPLYDGANPMTQVGVAVGYVTGRSNDGLPVDGDFIRVYLYDKPRLIGAWPV